jgi:putative DNA-binding protein
MSGARHSIEQLQRWLQKVITHHGGVAAGVASDAARAAIPIEPRELEAIIPASQSQSSLERLAVYGNAYYVRLMQCLRELFPASQYAMGDDAFDDFAYGYLQSYPPRGYTLGKLSDNFVDYLAATRQEHFAEESADDAVENWSRFVVELARLEHVIDQVFDGPGVEDEPPRIYDQLISVPREDWPSIRLTPAPCLRLLAFEFPVNDYFTAFRRSEAPELPELRATWLAVTRRDYVVQRYELSETQFALLEAISSGSPIGVAIERAASQSGEFDTLLKNLSTWFYQWARDQFFLQLDGSNPSPCPTFHGGNEDER